MDHRSSHVVGESLRETSGPAQVCPRFLPQWPSTSPYVTSVGGTIIQLHEDSGRHEEVASDVRLGSRITTGGGFSDVFRRPYYQDQAILNYLNNHSDVPPQHYFKRGTRGYPDVSAIATNYLIQVGASEMMPIAGTSASTPAVAGLLALVNDQRLNVGLPVLGFVNPVLYTLLASDPEVFHDITTGSNACSANVESCCSVGYEAGKGWDPVTGIGSVNVTALIRVLTRVRVVSVSPESASHYFSPSILKIVVVMTLLVVGLVSRQRMKSSAIPYTAIE